MPENPPKFTAKPPPPAPPAPATPPTSPSTYHGRGAVWENGKGYTYPTSANTVKSAKGGILSTYNIRYVKEAERFGIKHVVFVQDYIHIPGKSYSSQYVLKFKCYDGAGELVCCDEDVKMHDGSPWKHAFEFDRYFKELHKDLKIEPDAGETTQDTYVGVWQLNLETHDIAFRSKPVSRIEVYVDEGSMDLNGNLAAEQELTIVETEAD